MIYGQLWSTSSRLRFNSSTALRALCIRSLVIRELLIPFIDLDAEELLGKTFPDYLIPLYRAIHVWKGTENSQWPHLSGILTATTNLNPPSDREMWADVVYDGPLINFAVLAFAILPRVNEGDADLDIVWRTIEILSTSLGLTQLRTSAEARARSTRYFSRSVVGLEETREAERRLPHCLRPWTLSSASPPCRGVCLPSKADTSPETSRSNIRTRTTSRQRNAGGICYALAGPR